MKISAQSLLYNNYESYEVMSIIDQPNTRMLFYKDTLLYTSVLLSPK